LWRCPVCHVNDALIHYRPWFRPQTVACEACGTRWIVQRVPGNDFRLKVVSGPARLVGLDMPLSTWYAEMKANFRPLPIGARDGKLPEGEELYLEVDGVDLLPYRPSVLFAAWTSGEAPREQPGGQGEVPDWATIGMGRLLLTNRRLLWEGPQGSLDWWWPDVKAVFQPWQSTLGISYGAALYRFTLGNEAGLKWLTYASTFAQAADAQQGAQPAQRAAGARQAAVRA